MVTIKEIAEASGFSSCTVSRVLSGKIKAKREVTAKRSEHIRKVADELGYRMNTSARSVRTGRFHMVGLVLHENTPCSWYPKALLEGINEELEVSGLGLMLERLGVADLNAGGSLPRFFRESRVDGFIVNILCRMGKKLVEAFSSQGFHVVWSNFRYGCDCVFPDDLNGSRELTRILLGMGHKRVAYVAFDDTGRFSHMDHYSYAERLRGYLETMDDAGLKAEAYRYPACFSRLRLDYASDVLDKLGGRYVGAVICSNFFEAESVYREGIRRGLRLPEDMYIATFSTDDSMLALTEFPAMVLPFNEVGKKAVRMLLRKISGEGTQAPEPLPCSWNPHGRHDWHA